MNAAPDTPSDFPPLPRFAGPAKRHPGEIPLLVVSIAVTVIAYIALFVMLGMSILPTELGLLLAIPLIYWFIRGRMWGQIRANGVRITPTQFPEAYQMVMEASQRFGMPRPPEAYVVLGNGQINAFASGHQFRRFVVVYSDLFEVGGKVRNPEVLRFIIGHEIGHIAAGHTSWWRLVGMAGANYIPILGQSLSRSQEYTADNFGYCNQPAGAARSIGVLAAGKYLLSQIDFNEFADRASMQKGFFVWLANLTATHPVLTWRAAALRNRERPGHLFFRPHLPERGVGGGYARPFHPVAFEDIETGFPHGRESGEPLPEPVGPPSSFGWPPQSGAYRANSAASENRHGGTAHTE